MMPLVYKAISHCGGGFAIPGAYSRGCWMVPAVGALTGDGFSSRVLLFCCCEEIESVKGAGEGSTEG
jgi:hypothetical protein